MKNFIKRLFDRNKMDRFYHQIKGLHSLLPKDERFSYSVFVSSNRSLQLTAPNMEILVADNEEELNLLAKTAKGKWFLIIGENDHPRCDLLYRYEQILRMTPNCENTVLYCKNDDEIHFPYVFSQNNLHSMLIPAHLWHPCGSRLELALKLDLAKATFKYIPHQLFTSQPSSNMDAKSLLQSYANQKGLNWTYTDSLRAIPELKEIPKIHVIIPFKDQKDLTLKAVKSVLNQKGVHTFITALDNGSTDTSISQEIKELGVEVFHMDEPFNYSRLNNQAVKRSTCAYPLLLFINNDVELQSEALVEMARWIDQPSIGMVGCRLNYPNGTLQHGGLRLSIRGDQMHWNSIESASLGVVDGLTAACMLMKKELFNRVGGFDEVYYPIAYSDIALVQKIKKLGYLCFFTPYAIGIHHESASRKKTNIEDIEFSTWFNDQWEQSSPCPRVSMPST